MWEDRLLNAISILKGIASGSYLKLKNIYIWSFRP
jgi:hypothetical protein